ncbi:MAG: exodeoxyribonuclease VII small subunit [Candidatus Binatia bacterium]
MTAMASNKTKKTGAPDFEQVLAQLEATVRGLEAGDLPLEESLAAFEKGVALVRALHSRLDAVQTRIDELTQAPDGSSSLTPLAGAGARGAGKGDVAGVGKRGVGKHDVASADEYAEADADGDDYDDDQDDQGDDDDDQAEDDDE